LRDDGITVLRSAVPLEPWGSRTTTFDELAAAARTKKILRQLCRYRDARLVVHSLDTITRPLASMLLVRALSHGSSWIEDASGRRLKISLSELSTRLIRYLRDWTQHRDVLREVSKHLDELDRRRGERRLVTSAPPLYLRTDLWFGLQSGGSVSHVSGVLNEFARVWPVAPILFTTDSIPAARTDIERHIVPLGPRFWDFPEIKSVSSNAAFEAAALRLLGDRKIAFIYQRYSLNNYAGVRLARRYAVPLVLEYNGSEIWLNLHWGRPLRHEALSERVELLDLRVADVVVVVSDPMKNELVARGIDGEKVLVNPNGVDPDRYSPDIDGEGVRKRYDLADHLVVGFIGTFGPWHGAEVLTEAFAQLLRRYPEYRDCLRLLMIGDGPTLPEARRRLAAGDVLDAAVFTGRTSQEEGPAHLAACDILVSPHVPNADGTPFFGSPTKLFEYMAIGKAIVASDLDQIGEVLEHDRTGWLVRPGDAEALTEGLRTLIEDPERRSRLGRAARDEVVAKYTWNEHTRKIIEKLRSRCA